MLRHAPRRLTGQSGFTLVELLVASAAGIVVVFGLTTILFVVLNQSQMTLTRVNATQHARIAFDTIENDLHSACVSSGATGAFGPIQANSDANDLIFVTYTGPSLNPTPAWHEISLTSSNTLTDTVESMTANAGGGWTPVAASAKTSTMLFNVSPVSGAPAFQYFAYASTAAPDGEYWWVIPNGLDAYPNGTIPSVSRESLPLSAGAALQTVEVVVTLNVGASASTLTKPSDAGTSDPQTDAINLRLTTPPDEAPAGSQAAYGPCQ